MASFTNLFFIISLFSPFLLLSTHARESEFFNKVPTETDFDNYAGDAKSLTEQTRPAKFERGTQAYGLSESRSLPAATGFDNSLYNNNKYNYNYNKKQKKNVGAQFRPATTAADSNKFDAFYDTDGGDDDNDDKNKNNKKSSKEKKNKGSSKYFNGEEEWYSHKPLPGIGQNNYYDNAAAASDKNSYNSQIDSNRFAGQQKSAEKRRGQNGQPKQPQRQGMSDTRFMYNGLYAYDTSKEKNNVNAYNPQGTVSGNQYGAKGNNGNVNYGTLGRGGYNRNPNNPPADEEDDDGFQP